MICKHLDLFIIGAINHYWYFGPYELIDWLIWMMFFIKKNLWIFNFFSQWSLVVNYTRFSQIATWIRCVFFLLFSGLIRIGKSRCFFLVGWLVSGGRIHSLLSLMMMTVNKKNGKSFIKLYIFIEMIYIKFIIYNFLWW